MKHVNPELPADLDTRNTARGANCLPLPAWYQRLYAWLLSGKNGLYESVMAPEKERLFTDLSGTVIELGPGAGTNIPYFRNAARWIGLEPNPFFHRTLEEKLKASGLPGEIEHGTAERIPAPDGSADAVVATLVLCSVSDAGKVLEEVMRVLRSGGRFCFIEHVAAPADTGMRQVQRLIRPLWTRIAGGCRPDQETWRLIEALGLKDLEIRRFKVSMPVTAPHIAGRGIKP